MANNSSSASTLVLNLLLLAGLFAFFFLLFRPTNKSNYRSSSNKAVKKPNYKSGPDKSDYSHIINEYKDSEPGTIGDLIKNEYMALERESVESLLETTPDRKIAMDILRWFEGKVNNMDYYAVRESEPEPGEPNYAIVMVNDSNYDFKEFSCKATILTETAARADVQCIAKDWNRGTEGMLWFSSNKDDIQKLTVDVRNIKYIIGNSDRGGAAAKGRRKLAEDEDAARIRKEAEDKLVKQMESFNKYFDAQNDFANASELRAANIILKKLNKEKDATKRSKILGFYDKYLPLMTEVIEASGHSNTDIDATIETFTKAVKAFYKDLYDAEEIVDINSTVIEQLAVQDGLVDPMKDDKDASAQ